MPAFQKPNCPIKILLWGVFSGVVSIIIISLAGHFMGFIGATIVMLLSIIANWYLVDQFGDSIFTDKDFKPNLTKIKENENKKLISEY